MLSCKKLISLLVIGMFINQCLAMESDNALQTLPATTTPPKTSMLDCKSWDELVQAKGWKTDHPMKQKRKEELLSSLPSDLKMILEEFANEESCPYLYKHALILQGYSGIASMIPFAFVKQFKNISSTYFSADSLMAEEKHLPQHITHLFNLAKQEKRLIITIDRLNLLFDQTTDTNSTNSIALHFLQEINNLKHSSVFVLLTTNKIQNFPKCITDQLDTFKMIKSHSIQTLPLSLPIIQSEPTFNPFDQTKTLDELIERMGWHYLSRDMTEEDATIIFNSLPNNMRTRLQQFARPESRTTCPYWHGFILNGSMGTGKTTAAFAIAHHFKFKHIFIPASLLVDEWKNSKSIDAILRLVALAKKENNPIFITIDDADILLNHHKSKNSSLYGILETFLEIIDSLQESNVFIMFITNRLHDYPTKFTSCFQENTVTLPNPSEDSRRAMIEYLMQDHQITEGQETVEEVDNFGEGIIIASEKQESLKDYLVRKSTSFNYFDIDHWFDSASSIAQEKLGNYDTIAIPTKQDFALAYKQLLPARRSIIMEKLKKISTFCNKHTELIVAIGASANLLNILILALRHFYKD